MSMGLFSGKKTYYVLFIATYDIIYMNELRE